MYTRVKTQSEQQAMRDSGRMLADTLNLLKRELEPGMTTKQLADMAAKELKALGAEAPFLGYGNPGFPDVICISVNEQVVHGVPGARVIEAGDIVSLDFGVRYKGMTTDSALSVIAGGKPKQQRHAELVEFTEKAMLAGVAVLQEGVRTGDIGAAVQIVLDRKRYGIVRDLVGHGVGHHLHEDPNIPNYGRPGSGPELHAGMTIAIEPMATLGGEAVYVGDDDWTILTRDGSWAAHFEHTVLITEDGAEILTDRG